MWWKLQLITKGDVFKFHDFANDQGYSFFGHGPCYVLLCKGVNHYCVHDFVILKTLNKSFQKMKRKWSQVLYEWFPMFYIH